MVKIHSPRPILFGSGNLRHKSKVNERLAQTQELFDRNLSKEPTSAPAYSAGQLITTRMSVGLSRSERDITKCCPSGLTS